MWLVFEIVAVTLWLTKDNLFYLLNFSYIGSAIALGLLLFQLNYRHARRIGFIRYITFTASLVFVGALFLCHVENIEQIMFWAFLVGNILYYAIGIILAFAFRDNRAFCKYICPITVFLKPMSYFSLLRVKCDKERCVSCGKCKRVCPMNVDVTDNSRKRENGTVWFCWKSLKFNTLKKIWENAKKHLQRMIIYGTLQKVSLANIFMYVCL